MVRPQEHVLLTARRLAAVAAFTVLGQSCRERPTMDTDASRSDGNAVAALSVEQQVEVYRAAINAAFDIGPNLVLLLHPVQLPAEAGFDGGSNQSDALYSALHNAQLVAGRCVPSPATNALRAPTCEAPQSGYVIRGSEIFQRSSDTLQFNLHSEIYAPTNGRGTDAFAFEMAYRLVQVENGRYRAVAEGRVRQVGRK